MATRCIWIEPADGCGWTENALLLPRGPSTTISPPIEGPLEHHGAQLDESRAPVPDDEVKENLHMQHRILRASGRLSEMAGQLLSRLGEFPKSGPASLDPAPCFVSVLKCDEERSGDGSEMLFQDQALDPMTEMAQGLSAPFSAKSVTTIMVRNIPVPYTQEALLEEWPPDGSYDFLYLPRYTKLNLSYAFINFITSEAAQLFAARWNKMRLARYSACKPLNICSAKVQGLQENLKQLATKRVRRMAGPNEPIVFIDGQRVPFLDAITHVSANLPGVAIRRLSGEQDVQGYQ